MVQATAGLQSSVDVNTASPVIQTTGMLSKPYVWSWVWFAVAMLVIFGFHLRVFGHPIPPSANFP